MQGPTKALSSQRRPVHRMIRIALLVSCGAASGACAHTDITVDLPQFPPVTSAVKAAGREVVVIAPFGDLRPQQHRCGIKKTSTGESASIYCRTPPSVWIGTLLIDGLRQAGFRVRSDAPASSTALRIEGTLTQLFVEPDVRGGYFVLAGYHGYQPEADIGVKLVGHTSDGLRAERSFYVKGVGKPQDGDLQRNYEVAVEEAATLLTNEMAKAVGDLVDEVAQLRQKACAGANVDTPPAPPR